MCNTLKTIILCITVAAVSANMHQYDSQSPPENVVNLTRCNELNLHRWELHKCCKYPHINLHRVLMDTCLDECIGSNDECCPMGCLWRITKIVYDSTNVNLNGLKRTLKSSVFDSEWDDLIENSVDECASEVRPAGLEGPCQFPGHLPKLLGCTIKKLFLQCPQMHPLPVCETTKTYVQECM